MNPFGKRLTRRQFIKRAAAGAAGLGLGLFALDRLFTGYAFLGSPFRGGAPDSLWKWSREAYHYTRLGNNVQCQVCPNRCILGPGDRSVCRVKVNKDGKLYTLAYGNPCAVHMDPVEKKPLFHFMPGTGAFSVAEAGCNLRCLNCQNWEISQSTPEETQNAELFPGQAVRAARQYDAASIAYTYSEPTAWYEYMYDTAKLARKGGLRNIWITNGYMNGEALADLSQYLDAANVDLKSFSEGTYNRLNSGRLQPVLDTLVSLKERGIWLEVTNLIVPTYTDGPDMIREMCRWIKSNLGPDYPLHFSRFTPYYKLDHLPPTPVSALEQARNIAYDEGLKYPYIGNVPGHEGENTYCPGCGKLIIDRTGYKISQFNIQDGSCSFCGEDIAGVWS